MFGESAPAISDYAIIGDSRICALVSSQGSIDWLCLPQPGAPSVFAALLDPQRGGRFRVSATEPSEVTRRYVPETNVLETTFSTPNGRLRVTDLVPILDPERSSGELEPMREIIRVVEALEGNPELEIFYEPRPNYGRTAAGLHQRSHFGWMCEGPHGAFFLRSEIPLELDADGASARGRVTLRQGERRALSLSCSDGEVAVFPPLGDAILDRVEQTCRWWRDWSAGCTYEGPWRDLVLRSALALKLLSYAPSGAVIAAPTASLPEWLGGTRNWDYRYCWLRDASMTLTAFVDIGYHSEGFAFFEWLLHSTRLTRPRLQVLYDVYGRTDLPEYELDHLDGYRASRPVRIGNEAALQHQLDIYGAVVLAAYRYVRRGGTLDKADGRALVGFGSQVAQTWQLPDSGMWEIRGEQRHYTTSKVLAWAALECLIRLHESGNLRAPVRQFAEHRDAIRAAIEARAYSKETGTYGRAFEDPGVEAGLLLLARCGFVQHRDSRMIATAERIRRELGRGRLLYRYPAGFDGIDEPEGAFGLCSFWLVDHLARRGEIDDARAAFAELAGYANDVGLFAEEIDPNTGAALGNFPQAFTHCALIEAAVTLQLAEQAPLEDKP